MIIKHMNLSPSQFNLVQILNIPFKTNFNATLPYRLYKHYQCFLLRMKFPNHTDLFN
jgi:hypothetical protein